MKNNLGGAHIVTGETQIEDMQARHILEKQFVQPLSDSTTPDVRNRRIFEAGNTAPVTITDFLNGSPGQRIYILGDGFTTIQDGTFIKTNTGANKVLDADVVYTFTFFKLDGPPTSHKWVEDSGGSGGGSAVIPSAHTEVGTDLLISSTTYIDLDTSLDLTIPAAANDILVVSVSGLWGDENATWGYLDVATIVAAAVVNYISTFGAAGVGVQAWRAPGDVADFFPFGGSIHYTVQAGDISGGNVLLRLRTKVLATNRRLYASALHFGVMNLGH